MLCRFLLCASLFFSAIPFAWCAETKIAISSHGGGSGLLAHTLPGLVLAAATGIDFLEQELVLTKDDQLIVFDTLNLEQATDVAKIFPGKQRPDGHYYAVDFTLAEIRQLRRVVPVQAATPLPALGIPTFAESLALVRHLEADRDTPIGIAPEILHPRFHRQEGKDISRLVLETLQRYNYLSKDSPVLLQCFDGDELQRIHNELMPALMMELQLVQLIGAGEPQENMHNEAGIAQPYDFDWMYTRLGLRVLSSYAAALALDTSRLADSSGNPLLSEYLDNARVLGLKIFTYPLKNSPLDLPPFATDFETLLDFYYTTVGVDGVITESPHDTVSYLRTRQKKLQETPPKWPLDPDLPPFSFGSQDPPAIILHSGGTP